MFDQIANVIKSAAPAIATALGGPAAGGAVKLLTSAFGGSADDPADLLQRIQQDPEAMTRLKELEYNHAEEMRRLTIEAEKNTLVHDTEQTKTINETMRVEYKNNVYWRRAVGWAFAITVFLYPVMIFGTVWQSDVSLEDMKGILVAMKEYWYVVGLVLGLGAHHAGKQGRQIAGEKKPEGIAGAIRAIRGER